MGTLISFPLMVTFRYLVINGIPLGDNELKTRAIAHDKATIFIALDRIIKNILYIFKTLFLKIKIIFLKPFDFQCKGYKFHL